MNGDILGNRKLFWKEIQKIKESKGNLQRIVNRDDTFMTDETHEACRGHFKYLHNISSNEEVKANVWGF